MTTVSGSQPRDLAKFNIKDPIETILTGALDDISRNMESIVDKIDDQEINRIREVAEQVFYAISTFAGSCVDSKMTYEKADKLLQENINRIVQLAEMINSKESLAKISSCFNTLTQAFSNDYYKPVVNAAHADFVVETDSKDPKAEAITKLMITVFGNFYYVKSYPPVLCLEGKELQPKNISVHQLKYEMIISKNELKKGFNYLHGTLQVKWAAGYLSGLTIGLLSEPNRSIYRLMLRTFPAIPGTLEIFYRKEKVTRIFASQAVEITSDEEEGSFSAVSNEGWCIEQGTAKLQWDDGPHGVIFTDIVDMGKGRVGCRFINAGGSGKVRILFNESQEEEEGKERIERAEIFWGTTKILDPALGEKVKRIRFVDFTGEHHELLPWRDGSNRYIGLYRADDGKIHCVAKSTLEIRQAILSVTRKEGEVKVRMSDRKEGQ